MYVELLTESGEVRKRNHVTEIDSDSDLATRFVTLEFDHPMVEGKPNETFENATITHVNENDA